MIMKNLLLLLCFVSALSACKKDPDPEADAASKVAGTYQMTSVTQNGVAVSLPLSQSGVTLSGIVVATRKEANTVTIALTLKQTGQADQTGGGDLTLAKSGNSYDLMDGTTKVGTADGTNLTLSVSDGSGQSSIIAKR